MATPERDTVYTNDASRPAYVRESNGTAWFVGVIVVLALLAIGYLVFSANSGPASSAASTGAIPAVTEPATPMSAAPADSATPMTAAPAETATPATAPTDSMAPAATPAAP